ncbi:MAG: hypothetical protein ACI865_001161 [Flavobacteriaceae bacterium]|jgi:uncharacterized protein YkwD
MKKASLIFLTFLIVANVSAGEATYKRLKKLYDNDSKKCLILAKRYIKYRPEKSSSYFFASMIYKDKVKNARNAKGKYFHITKSLSYANKFMDRSDQKMMNKVNWHQEVEALQYVAHSVINELSESEFADLGVRLNKKVENYEFLNTAYIAVTDGNMETEYNATETELVDASDNIENSNSSGFVKVPGQYYGLPQGTEMIRSHNRQSEQEMLHIINLARKEKGLVELEWEEKLANACRYHAYDLGSQNYFAHDSHDRINGELVEVGGTFERIRKFYSESFVNSENIAAGNEAASDTYDQWYNSKGHYENMFNSASRKVGIGVFRVPGTEYEYYWVFCTALD